jgi:transcription elongation factor Elf1
MEYSKKNWAPYDDWSQRVAFICDFCNHVEGVKGIYLVWYNSFTNQEQPSYLICGSCEKKYDSENESE